MPTIAIIGAGFSGTTLAARLLRTDTPALKVVLINRGGPGGFGRGLAYGTQSELHLLNVPAGRMSAFAERGDDFLRYLHARGVAAEGGSFVARHRYGAYLGECLERAVEERAPGTQFEHRVGEVVDLQQDDSQTRLRLADGSDLAADRVVLALGNFAPADPQVPDSAFFASPRYVRDPWAHGALEGIDPSQPVALIGSGLTMFDMALTLAGRHSRCRLIALSRRGTLPQAHRDATAPPTFAHAPQGILQGAATARAYLRAVRAEVRRRQLQGIDWREVIASLRPMTPQLWQQLPDRERARFLRHLRPYWDSHRHRAAPQTVAAIARLIEARRLAVHAARLTALADTGVHAELSIRPRGTTRNEVLRVGTVINCTGPSSDFTLAGERLLLALHGRGDIAQDPLRLGLEVNERLQIRDRLGRAREHWFCAGPLLKARDWEAVAVPELREQVRLLAGYIVNSFAAKP